MASTATSHKNITPIDLHLLEIHLLLLCQFLFAKDMDSKLLHCTSHRMTTSFRLSLESVKITRCLDNRYLLHTTS